jgi:hypothetical protein
MENPKVTFNARENAELEAVRAVRLLYFIKEAGKEGIMHTALLTATRIKARDMTLTLKRLEDDFEIVSRRHRQEFGLGRTPRRYWYKDFAPEDLTRVDPSVTAPLSLEAPQPLRGRTCRQCGGAIPEEGPAYCSPACTQVARSNGSHVSDLLANASDPRIFAQLARLVVTMDLVARGLYVATDPLGVQLIVHDNAVACILHVVPISASGRFPAPESYERVAFVYRDGRVKYGGTDPLVFDEPVEIPTVDAPADGINPPGDTSKPSNGET